MDEPIDVASWGEPVDWTAGSVHVLPAAGRSTASALARVVAATEAPWLLLWDPLLGAPEPGVARDLARGRADVWHAGIALGLAGLPGDDDYVHPTWPLTVDPTPDQEGTSWRLSLGAALVRTSVLRVVGGLDPAFHGLTGAGLELGRRLVDRGAVTVHAPQLVGHRRVRSEPLSAHDRLTLLRRWYAPKWVTYATLRRALAGPARLASIGAWSTSRAACAAHPALGLGVVVEREPGPQPEDPTITVVLPTVGRPELVRPLLESLARQTLPATQVIVVDQNPPAERAAATYADLDLPLEVVHQDERGQWRARNAGVQRATGEWLAFVDDDSEIGHDFLEQHLAGLVRYQADLSTGASLAAVGAPVPASYARFRVADQWDSGNGMCHRRLFEDIGLFDEQFDCQRRGDAEFGLRAQCAGRLVVHNPLAVRRHLKAATGGLRTDGSWDGFRRPDRHGPLPQPSMLYYSRRYHTRRQEREDLLLGLVTSVVPYHLKRRVGTGRWATLVAAELLHVPSTARRVALSRRLAGRMVDAGPRIPALEP